MLVAPTIAGAHVTRIPARCADRPAPLLCAIHWHRDRADQLRHRMMLPRLRYAHQARHHPSWRPRILRHWRHAHATAARQWRRYEASPWLHGSWHTAALCVHSHEAAWNEPGGLGPSVSGGMQIGDSEWAHFGGQAYAPRAYQATPAEQLHVAYRYWQVSRWYPWPATAAMCGLL